jgi:hypothetical protein
MRRGSGDYEVEAEDYNLRHAKPTASQRRRPITELKMFNLGTCDGDEYVGEDGDNADGDAYPEEDVSQADDGSMQNVED